MNDEFNKLFSVNNSNHMNNSYNNNYNNQLNKNLNNTNEDNKTVEDVLKEIQQQYRKLKNISHPKSYRDEKKPKKF